MNVAVRNGEVELPDSFCSVGVHPSHVGNETLSASLHAVGRLASNPTVIAIGECGIDRAISTGIDVQIQAFLAQVHIAERVCKPLILHSVRSGSDILSLRRSCDPSIPWVVHGYAGNPDMAERLMSKGILLSFGAALLDPKRKTADVFRLMPLDRIFLETDESDVDIARVYEGAALLRGMSVAMLADVIGASVARTFPGIDQMQDGARP
ncbi:MAG: TatD family hydrolase [Bacteroidia bacterium]|nr:TatD family hydrolase [Bacteroidia bacterium]